MQGSFFKGKKILITGSSGFVGSHLSVRLKELGAEIYGISKSAKTKDILKVDVLDYERLHKITREREIEICFHLAAESLVETGQEDPYETFKVNIEGTLNILECARKNRLKKIIIASTVHVYGKNRVPYLERYTPKPSRPYETSKTCTDLIAQSYAYTYQLPVLIPRFVNIYGPGDLHFTRLIPKTIQAIMLGNMLTLWGGEAVREYLFIDDAIDAYLCLAQAPLPKSSDNRIFNFGSGNRISVESLIEKIVTLSGKKLPIKRVVGGRKLEIPSQYVSSRKAQKILGWKAKVPFDEGLRRTYAWYEKYFKN